MALLIKETRLDGEWEVNSPHRSRGITVRNVFQRDVENRSMEFNLTAFNGDEFWSPAHRHNFDQIRIGLEGVMNYGARSKLKPRTVAYYPEGTWYGPMACEGPSVSAIMQFDGASHGGYVTLARMDEATEVLRHKGRFEKGFYYPDGGLPKIDGYQASWEEVTGRKMVYVEPPRFVDAIYMDIDSFNWLPAEGGVMRKTLGRFGERDFTIEALLVPAGATAVVDRPGRLVVGFILTGEVEAGGSVLPKWSGAFAEHEDVMSFTGRAEASEVLIFTLPDLD
jgi:hypothetical protein